MRGLLKGLATTLSTAMRKPVTVQYPDERHALPVRQRSFPVLTWDFEHDEPFCTGCMVCVRNCPVDCMTAVMHDNPKYATGESNRRKIIEKFWIDYGRCMRCNICVEVCNFEAIVMDNTWSGHEHGAFDRRDLHIDLDELLKPSRTKRLVNPFRPQDDLERLEKTLAGEEPPLPGMQGARLDAMRAQEARLAQGLPAGIKEREVEAPKVAAPAAGAAGAAGAEAGEVLSESKIRARRMRAEREAKEFTDRGEAVPQEVLDRIELYRNMKPGEAASAGAAAAGGGGVATGEALTGTNPDGSMRFPPGVGDGPKGDPNSAEKVRARRMRAERQFKELSAAGEPIPDEIAKSLYDLGSDLAPGGSIWASLAGQGGGAAAPVAAAAGGGTAAAGGAWTPPPGVDVGGKGEPNSAEKLRAKRMRAERKAREALAAGEPIPDDIIATIKELGGTVPEKAG